MASPLVAGWLTRLVRTGRLTTASAFALSNRTIPARMLPQAPADGLRSREVAGPYVNAYAGNWKGQGAIRLSRSPAIRARYRDQLQRDFEKQTTGLARSVTSGKISVAEWQRRMGDAVHNHTVRQAALGKGGTHTKAHVIRDLDPKVRADLTYLQRFADEIALGLATGKPMSANAIASRSSLYAGTGRAEWFRQHEAAEARPGYVVRYRARDDGGTCEPCRKADGLYLPGQGNYPGEICRGRSRCRCRRELVYDRAAYDRLTGNAAAPQTSA